VGGVFVDWYSPSAVLALSLGAVAVSHAALWASPLVFLPSLSYYLWLWGINGFAQAFAWPALAKIFMAWFPSPETRGKMYAILATSQNAGAAIAPHLFAPLMLTYGWRAALVVPGVLAALAGIWVGLFVPDGPSPSTTTATHTLEKGKGGNTITTTEKGKGDPTHNIKSTDSAAKPVHERVSVAHTIQAVLSSPTLWFLGVSYFFNTLVRNAFTEVPKFILGSDGLNVDAHVRGASISGYELGAAAGGLAAGFISDKYFHGRRGPVMVLFALASAPLPLALLWVKGTIIGQETMVPLIYCLFGFTSFAPHVLNGLASREFTAPNVQSSAGGFAKALGQLGGAMAGAPLGFAIDNYGFSTMIVGLSFLCVASGVLAIPLWNTRAWTPTVLTSPLVVETTKGEETSGEEKTGEESGTHLELRKRQRSPLLASSNR
jgi:OPA family sugar phosphate sensor protein UhpC-like MFS transporter